MFNLTSFQTFLLWFLNFNWESKIIPRYFSGWTSMNFFLEKKHFSVIFYGETELKKTLSAKSIYFLLLVNFSLTTLKSYMTRIHDQPCRQHTSGLLMLGQTSGRLFMFRLKRIGPRTLLCRTLIPILWKLDLELLNTRPCLLI